MTIRRLGFAPRTTERFDKLHGMSAFDATGLLSLSVARSTGSLVGIYDAAEAGIADTGYVTLCEDHGRLCEHDTITLARSLSSAPEVWCPPCRGEDSTDH